MRQAILVLLLSVLVTSSGCGKARPILAKLAKQFVGKAAKPAARGRKAVPVVPVLARRASRVTQHVSRSRTLGARLFALRSHIPAHVYGRLLQEWQRNHAVLQSYEDQLANPSLSAAERSRIETSADAVAARNAEIERLVAEYG